MLGSCNTSNDLSNKMWIPNKAKDIDRSKRDQYDYSYKLIKSINKADIMRMLM